MYKMMSIVVKSHFFGMCSGCAKAPEQFVSNFVHILIFRGCVRDDIFSCVPKIATSSSFVAKIATSMKSKFGKLIKIMYI